MPSTTTYFRFIALLLAGLMLCASGTGCVRRRMTLRTFPPGAQVFIDDQEIGITPCSTSFVYYGTRKLTLIKDGYKTETLYHKIDPPWYQYPPLDFINENLNPREIRDERVIDVQLVPQEVVAPSSLLQRAEGLRTSSRTGQITSLPNLPPGAAPPNLAPPGKVGLPGEGLPNYEPIPYSPLPAPPAGSLPLPAPPAGSVPLPSYRPAEIIAPQPGVLAEPIAPGTPIFPPNGR